MRHQSLPCQSPPRTPAKAGTCVNRRARRQVSVAVVLSGKDLILIFTVSDRNKQQSEQGGIAAEIKRFVRDRSFAASPEHACRTTDNSCVSSYEVTLARTNDPNEVAFCKDMIAALRQSLTEVAVPFVLSHTHKSVVIASPGH